MKSRTIFLILFLIVWITPAAAIWANEAYDFRSPTSISNGTRPAQISLNVTNSTGTSNFTDVFTQGLCYSTNCTDIVVYLDNTTLLNYFTELNISAGIRGQITINVTANGTITLYYGRAGISAPDNQAAGTATFPFYDGFKVDKSKWTGDTAQLTLSNGIGVFNAGGAVVKNIYSTTSVQSPFIVEASIKRPADAVSRATAFGVSNTSGTNYEWLYYDWGPSNNMRFVNESSVRQDVNTNIVVNSPQTNKIIAESPTSVRWYFNDTQGTNSPYTTQAYISRSPMKILFQTYGSADFELYWVRARTYSANMPQWGTWGEQQELYYNNYTNGQELAFSVTQGVNVTFYYANLAPWWLEDGVLVTATGTTGIYSYYSMNVSANKTLLVVGAGGNSKTWAVTAITTPLTLISPANTTTGVSITPTLTWQEWPTHAPYTYQVSTDNQFLNIVASGLGSMTGQNGTSGAINLDYNTQYYWRVTNNNGTTSSTYQFTTATETVTPGRLNITAKDEQTNAIITTFTAKVYNSTAALNKSSASGWANYSSAEVSSGEYLIQVSATGYAPRSIIATSPDNVTVYLPSTGNTINTIAFYLLDYTTLFPYSTTKFTLSKNNTVMYSAYFDADAKTSVYLIQGDSYKVTLTNGENLQEWGNYIAVSSGNVEVTVTNIGVPDMGKYNYNISTNPSQITLNWSALNGTVYFTITKGVSKAVAHQLTTTVSHGQSNYIITSEDIYYITMNVSSNGININRSFAYDIRPANSTTSGTPWGYGSFTMPQKYMNYGSIIFLAILAGSFGAVHAALGAVILALSTIFFISKGWLQGDGIAIGFFSGLVVLIIIAYLRDKDGD